MVDNLNVKEQILKIAGEQFFQVGYSQVTTDALSAQLGISKKTLYKYFPNKKELLREVMKKMFEEIAGQVKAYIASEPDYLAKLEKLMTFLGVQMARVGTAVIQDFQKNAPDIWEEFIEFREKEVLFNFRGLLQEGITKGFIKPTIHQEIVMQMYLSSIRSIMNPAVLSQLPLSFREAHNMILTVIFTGILEKEWL